MLKINEIPLDKEPRKAISEILNPILDEPEMSEFDSAFLCGLIKKEHPKKIVEIGIAAGATTAIIIECLEEIGTSYEMYSVDYCEKYYRNIGDFPSGFMAKRLLEQKKLTGKHQFLLGGGVHQFLDQIGDDIDFMILDTMHTLPGELLDFIVLFKHLSKNAIVCLHDISLNNRVRGFSYMNATNVLFHSIVGEKFINYISDGSDEKVDYPNIGAFRINEDTERNIENVFQAFIMSWHYMPNWKDIKGYGVQIKKDYPTEIYHMWENAVMMNCRMAYPFPERFIPKGSKIVLYGAGNVGQEYYRQLKITQYAEVVAWVDADAKDISKVLNLKEGKLLQPDIIENVEFDYIVIAIMSHKTAFYVHEFLMNQFKIEKRQIVWSGKEIYEY